MFEKALHFLGNWSLNFNYWTAGKNTPAGPIWCPGLQSISNASNNIFNYSSSGNEGKDCVQLKIIQEASSIFNWRLQLKSCSERLIFACEVYINLLGLNFTTRIALIAAFMYRKTHRYWTCQRPGSSNQKLSWRKTVALNLVLRI